MSTVRAIIEPLLYVWVFIAPIGAGMWAYNKGQADAYRRIATLRNHS